MTRRSRALRGLLAAAGLFAGVLLLEAGMRLAGWSYGAVQKWRNWRAVSRTGTCRVLCLGESTTAGIVHPYPDQLEEILNEKRLATEFSVINEGMHAVPTSVILDQVPRWLEEHRPHIVVAMLGINDDPDAEFLPDPGGWRVVKYVKWLARWRSRTPAAAPPDADADIPREAVDRARAYLEEGKPAEAEAAVRAALERYPERADLWRWLGRVHLDSPDRAEAEAAFRHAMARDPGDGLSALDLAYLYKRDGLFGKAVEVLEEAWRSGARREPGKMSGVGLELGRIMERQGKPREAAEWYRRTAALAEEGERAPEPLRPETVRNYRRLKSLLDARGTPLVSMQYAMRDAEPLRALWAGEKDVTVVENRRNFEEALRREGAGALFKDLFAGDFGHGTARGNRLLAENAAEAVAGIVSSGTGGAERFTSR